MKVSVVIPVYNMEKYLGECLDSALGQTLGDIEVICVDDGSTDSSLSLLRDYEKKDSRVKVVTQKNSFAGAARNKGMAMASGEYLAFFDPDDFYDKDMLSLMYAQCEKTNADMCVCAGRYYYGDTGRYEPWNCLDRRYTPKKEAFRASELGKNAFLFMYTGPTNKLYRREMVEKYTLRFSGARTAEDFAFVCLCTALSARVAVCDVKPLAFYRKGLSGNAQSVLHFHPLDSAEAARLLREGLERAGVFGEYREAFENLMAMQIEKYAKKFCEYPEAFSEYSGWYRDKGREMCGIRLNSLNVSVASNVLMTFEGVTDETGAEEARAAICKNSFEYKGLYSGHQIERLRFAVRSIKKRRGIIAALGRLAAYVFEESALKARNRA